MLFKLVFCLNCKEMFNLVLQVFFFICLVSLPWPFYISVHNFIFSISIPRQTCHPRDLWD